MKKVLALFLLFCLGSPVFAWNDTGHMVVARIAWLKMTPEQRNKVSALLRKHPHYAQYLIRQRPDSIPVDEWVWMRAATWGDWIRGGLAGENGISGGPWLDYPFV